MIKWIQKLLRRNAPVVAQKFEPIWTRPESGSMVDLDEEAVRWVWANSKCPYCRTGDLYEGPSGGLSTNYFCGNVDACNSRFNITSPGFVGFGGNSAAVPAWGQFTGPVPESFAAQMRAEKSRQRHTINEVA